MVTVLTCVMPAMLLILTGSSGANASLLASSREMTVRSDPVSTTKLNGPLPSMCIGKVIRRDMSQPVAIMVGALLSPSALSVIACGAGVGDRAKAVPWSISSIAAAPRGPARRSEEQTSELQSLMRNSYAVFCLKKTMQTDEHDSKIRR